MVFERLIDLRVFYNLYSFYLSQKLFEEKGKK